MFKVIKKCDAKIKETDKTIHYIQRMKRITAYSHLLSNKMLQCFVVDTNHKNGLEIHCINEHGLIYIYNKTSQKLITIIHPRPRQIKRYYRALNLTTSKDIKKVINETYKRNIDHALNTL